MFEVQYNILITNPNDGEVICVLTKHTLISILPNNNDEIIMFDQRARENVFRVEFVHLLSSNSAIIRLIAIRYHSNDEIGTVQSFCTQLNFKISSGHDKEKFINLN